MWGIIQMAWININHSLWVFFIKVCFTFRDSSSIEATFSAPNLVCLYLFSFAYFPFLFDGDLTFPDVSRDNDASYGKCIFLFSFFFNIATLLFLCCGFIFCRIRFFPENIRDSCSPPLPILKHLKVKFRTGRLCVLVCTFFKYLLVLMFVLVD